MGRMADAEVRNAENTFDCWTNFQKTIQAYNIKYWDEIMKRDIMYLPEDWSHAEIESW
jgi:hypothetical protein